MTLKEGIDFRLHLEGEKDENIKIELTCEPYRGIVYQYGEVQVFGENAAEAQLVFDFVIYEPAELKEAFEKDGKEALPKGLTDFMGELIFHFVREQINDETRTNNLIESFDE